MHTEPRPGGVDRIYLHTNEGPQVINGARNLAVYLHTIEAGYHVIVDHMETIRVAADELIVWGAGGDNQRSLHVCMIGFAGQDWSTPYSTAEMDRAAVQVAAWCTKYAIPIQHVEGAPGQAPVGRGIARHADNHSPASGGHTDPGYGFPIAWFIAVVQEIVGAPAKLAAFLQMVASFVKPIKAGDRGNRVLFVQKLLRRRGYSRVRLSGIYGQEMVNAIADFKHEQGWAAKGAICGMRCLKALVAK